MKKVPLALTLGTIALSMTLAGNVAAAQSSSSMGGSQGSGDMTQDQLRTQDQDKLYLQEQDKLRTQDKLRQQDQLRTQDKLRQQDQLRTQDKLQQQDQLRTQDRERLRIRIRTVQQALNRHGAMLKPDGILGPRTRAALREFQRANGLRVTGTITTETEARLGIH